MRENPQHCGRMICGAGSRAARRPFCVCDLALTKGILMNRTMFVIALALSFAATARAQTAPSNDLTWPVITQQAKPWTRWWWLGSAVDAKNLTRELELFSKAGLGGVE